MVAAVAESFVDYCSKSWDALSDRLEEYMLEGWTPAKIGDLGGMVALVTGGNSGIGFHVTRKLAENGAKVYMVSRTQEAGEEAVSKIRTELGKGAQVELLIGGDLTRMSNVLRLIDTFKQTRDPLHILINNAGVFFPGKYAMTPEGIEQTLAVNLYAPALLTLGLMGSMAPGGRIIEMSSEGEGILGKYDPSNFRGDKYTDSGTTPYGTAKMYLIMFARELATRLKALPTNRAHPDVFAVQPGLVNTPGHNKMDRKHYLSAWNISGMGKVFGQSAYHGSWSTLFAATEPKLAGKGFAYLGPNQFGLYHNVERQPGQLVARNPVSCWTVYEGITRVLREVLGDRMPPVPEHPTDLAVEQERVTTHAAKAA